MVHRMASRSGRGVLAVVVGVVVLAGIGWWAEGDESATGAAGSGDRDTVATGSPPSPEPAPAEVPAPADTREPADVPAPAGDDAPSPAPPPDPLIAPARAALPQLEVKGRAPKTGYDRDLFGQAWSDDVSAEFGRNGCDARNDILGRDLEEITYRPGTGGCVVLTGVLEGPYTGERIEFERGRDTSSEVQIDHVVAMSDAWQKGAQQLPPEQLQEFANDPLNLLAVAGRANQQKGDGDAATWLPPHKGARCSYVSRQVLVKERYTLWVTPAEREAMERVLAGCG